MKMVTLIITILVNKRVGTLKWKTMINRALKVDIAPLYVSHEESFSMSVSYVVQKETEIATRLSQGS